MPRHATARRSPWRYLWLSLAVCAALAAGAVAGSAAWARHQLAAVSTFQPAAPAVAVPGGSTPVPVAVPLDLPPSLDGVTTFLLFTTGSQDMTAKDARRYGITDYRSRGNDGLTDSIILVVLDARRRDLSLLSIPRDTWLTWRGTRINATFDAAGAGATGAKAFSDDVTRLTGIPVNHVIAVNFTAAARLTDVVGGVDIAIPVPMKDAKSHLYLPAAGCVHMDGRTTLEFSRSRHTRTFVAGQWAADQSATDFGRSSRQQAVMSAALGKLLSPRLPLYLPSLASTAQATLRIDKGLNFGELLQSARVLATGSSLAVHHYGLPSLDTRIGAADVEVTNHRAARPILARVAAHVPHASLPAVYGPAPVTAPAPTTTPIPVVGAAPSPAARDATSPVVVEGFQTGRNGSYSTCSGGTTPDPSASPR